MTAWIATGSKLASFVALMKVFLHALLPWSNPSTSVLGPGWIGIVAVIAAVTMTYGNFAALAQRNLKRMLAYSSIAHAGYMLVGVAAVSVSIEERQGRRRGPLLPGRLRVRERRRLRRRRLAGARQGQRRHRRPERPGLPGAAAGHLHPAADALADRHAAAGRVLRQALHVHGSARIRPQTNQPISLIWLVALGLFNSVVSAFYYVRVLKAMFLREPGEKRLAPPSRAIALPIVLGTLVVVIFGIMPDSLIERHAGRPPCRC